MKKHLLLLFILCSVIAEAQNNAVKGRGILYTNGVPTVPINAVYDSEWAVDTTNNKKIYLYDRDAAAWIVAGYFVQPTNVVGVPTHTPHDAQSIIAINNGDSLYHYRSGSWHLISGGGGGGSDGDGIYDGSGTVPNPTYAKIGTNSLNTNVFSLGYTRDTTDPFATPISSRGYFLDANGFVSIINSDSTKLASSYVTLDRSNINIVADGSSNQSILQLDTTFISLQNGGALIQLIGDDNQLNSDSLYIGITGGYIEINGSKGSNGQVLKSNGYSFDWANEGDASTTNEIQTLTATAGKGTLRLDLGGGFVQLNDSTITNEGVLAISGGANLATIISNTLGSNTAYFTGAGINTVSESGDTITITATEVDGSTTNEGLLSWNVSANLMTLTSNTSGSETLLAAGRNGITLTDSSGYLIFTGSAAGTTDTTYFHHQYGNSYGATWKAGTNDNFGIDLEIQDTAAFQINTSQVATFTMSTSTTNALVDQVYIDTKTYNTAAAGFGGSIMFKGESTTTESQGMATIGAYWTTATHASREAALTFQLGDAGGSLAEVLKLDRVYNSTGALYLGTSSALTMTRTSLEAAGVFTILTPASSTLTLQSANAATAAIHLKPFDNAGSVEVDNVSYTSTSLAKKSMVFDGLYTAASGSGTMTAIAINNTYNLTSTASGAQIGIDINPTLTSLTAATYRGINIPYSNAAAYGIYQSGPNTLNLFGGETQFEKQLKLKEIADPGSPPSGYGFIVAFTDDSLYYKNNSGAFINLCRSSGGGGTDAQYLDTFSLNSKNIWASISNDGVAKSIIYLGSFLDTATSFSGDVSGIYSNLQLGSGVVGSTEIATGGVATADLADSAVTTIKIISNAVGTTALASSSVTSLKISDSTIVEVDLATNSVGSNAIKASAVGTSEINDNSIEGSDLANILTLTGNTTFGNSANDLTLSAISGANEGVVYVTNGYVNQYTTNGSITSRINNNPDSIYITSKNIDINADSLRLKLTGAYGTSGQFVKVGANGLLEFGSGGAATLNLSYDVANHEVDIDGGGTSAVIPLAVADGATEGVASFSATYFDASSGNITPDLTNGLASGSQGGWLSSTNWTTFNSKANKSIYADDGRIDSTRYAQIDPDSAFFMGYFPDAATQTINFDGREIGISFQNELMTIHGRDSALQIWSALAMDEKPTLQLANAALSKRVYLALDTTYFRLHIEHGSDESNIYGYKDSIEVTSKKLFVSVDSFRMKLQGSFGTSGQFVKVGTNGLLTFGTGGGGASTNVLSYGTVTGILTSVVDGISDTTAIPLAAADGATMGIASFTAADFNSSAGNISIDYTNGQAASGSNKGFLTSADWTTFNNKLSAVTYANVTSGSIPDNTLVQALRSRNVAWGYFQNFPSGVNDEDRGIWMDDEVYIYANDSTSGNITRIYSDNGSWLMKVSNGSPNSYLQQTLTKNEFYIDDGTDNTLAFFGSDSIYLRTDRVRVETDSFKMVLSGSSGTNGQVLKSNGSVLYWAADATGGGGLSDGDYGDITVGGSGTTMTVDNDAITSAKIAAGTIVSGDVNDDHIILQGGNTIGETVVVGSNDANAFSIESNNVVRATVTGGASTGGAWTMTDVTSKTNTIEDVLTLTANSTGTAAANYGAGILFQGESSTTNSQDMAAIRTYWTTATHATREAAFSIMLADAGGALTEKFKFDAVLSGSGVLSIGSASTLTISNSAFTTAASYTVGNSSSALTLGGSSGTVTLSSASSSSQAILINPAHNTGSLTIGIGSYTFTTGTKNMTAFSSGYAPTSGTGVHNQLIFDGTYNQTGGANGITRNIYLNPTLTAVADFRGIESTFNTANAWHLYQTGSSAKGNKLVKTSIGTTTAPTALLLLAAGTTSIPPLQLTSGTNTSTPLAGAIEYDGTKFYATNGTTIRYTLIKGYVGNATLNFPSTAAQSSSDLTITVTGAADGDAVAVGSLSGAVNANSMYTAFVSATNTVTVRFCNFSSGAIDPASNDFQVTVFKPNN